MWQDSGFIQQEETAAEAMKKLQIHLQHVPLAFASFSEDQLTVSSQPGKWSKHQILGHLIDSAINNLKRFVDVQSAEQPFTLQPYLQDESVIVNNYNQLPTGHLLTLWQSLNQQIVFLVQNIPAEKLRYLIKTGYNDGQLRTLEWVISDYVAHLEHHLRQIFSRP